MLPPFLEKDPDDEDLDNVLIDVFVLVVGG